MKRNTRKFRLALTTLTLVALMFSVFGAVSAWGTILTVGPPWTEDISNPIFDPVAKAYYPTLVYDGSQFSGHGDAAYYKMWFGSNSGVGYACSDNGVSWTEGTNPVSGLVNANHPLVKYYSDGFTGANSGNNPSSSIMYYRIWYWPGLSYSINDIRYAESPGGTTWYNDQPLQNGTVSIISGGDPWWNRGSYGPCDVLYNPGASNTGTDWKFTMYYDGTTGGDESIGLGFSADGITWTGYDADADGKADPVLVGSGQDYVSRATIIKQGASDYRMWFSGGVGSMNHGIGYATSVDGITWTKSVCNPIFHKDDGVSWRDSRTYCPVVIYQGGTWKMWFSGKDVATSDYTIGYATTTSIGDYCSIQAAIDAASAGWTINVAAGTYNENLTINKSLTIQGDISGARPQIANTTGSTIPLMIIQASDVTIKNLHFYKSSTDDPDWLGNPLVTIPRAGSWGSYYIDYSNIHFDNDVLQGGRYGMFVCANDFKIENSQFLGQGSTSIDLTSVSGTTNILNNSFDGLSGSKKAVMVENLSDIDPATSGTINIEGNTVNDKREFFVYNQWIDPSQKVDINVTNNTITSISGDGVVIFDPREYIPAFNTALFAKINAVTVQYNDLSGVEAGNYAVKTVIDDDYPVLVDATNNWWGDPTGPYHPTSWIYDSQVITNPDGKGDEVSDYVLYDPWYRPTTPMASFVVDHAKLDFKKKADDDKVRVKGKLDPASDVDIDDDVTVTVGPLSETITMVEKGKKGDKWEYKRPKDGEGDIKHMTIDWKNEKFDIRIDDADLSFFTDVTNPVFISIQIGDDIGSESILMREHKHHWDYKVNKPKAVELAPLAITDPLKVVAYPNPIRDVDTATFQVMGTLATQVEEIRVQIYDLSGQLVWKDAAPGSKLDWHTNCLSGDYLANGIYLYSVQVRISGNWINQDTGKIAVLQ